MPYTTMPRSANDEPQRFNTLNICLFGVPCTGKSGVMFELAGMLSRAGILMQIVPEYAKELEWAGKLAEVSQLEISAEQYRRHHAAQHIVEVAITDAPLFVGALYAPAIYRDALVSIMRELPRDWTTWNILLERDISVNYQPHGRSQKTWKLSLSQKPELIALLDRECPGYVRMQTGEAAKILYQQIVEHLERQKEPTLCRVGP